MTGGNAVGGKTRGTRRAVIAAGAALLAAALAASCGGTGSGRDPKPIRFGIGAMLTPDAGRRYYVDLIQYLSEKTGRPIEVADAPTYAEVNSRLKQGTIDFSFVCSGPYVTGHDDFGLELLVQPQAYGEKVYFSYIIVPADSPARSLDDLAGKTFAFSDRDSNTGCLVPTYLLARQDKDPASFFGKLVFTGSHDGSIAGVAYRFVDGAAVDSLIYEYIRATNPQLAGRTRVITISQPFAIPPVVARPGADPQAKEAIRKALLGMDGDREGRKILAGMMIERFQPADDRAFDSIREMQRWLAEREKARAKPAN